ncbi:hypothetical protein EYF80_003628 [Liparis tanakae]|uniref:Uncharacterized protein n=1 Tax=Liparis tanakae TaxID=230148 RepID=A0A4Z2J8H4_9TELE|nr:hypothetical protein EYF80_003628 [Liparis tanakae]
MAAFRVPIRYRGMRGVRSKEFIRGPKHPGIVPGETNGRKRFRLAWCFPVSSSDGRPITPLGKSPSSSLAE